MNNFSILKWGGQHLTLLRRIAQKAVRHDYESDNEKDKYNWK